MTTPSLPVPFHGHPAERPDAWAALVGAAPSLAQADLLVTFEGPWETYRTLDLPVAAHHCHLVYAAPAGFRPATPVHRAVPGAGAHPWGTLPHLPEPAR
ncbi:hypothetical protein ACIGW0_16475 [Streptomyces bikiniensis]|uniref:Uncharacterized protein n=1 Tax=Streptomyces bikiniensis TaxID=1896 RepID=A0ABW8CX50_STRBI